MFKAVGTNRSLVSPGRKLFGVCLVVLCLSLVLPGLISPSALAVQSTEGLRFELPANGNLRIENLRGAVIAELWQENYVSVSAITDTGQQSRVPAIVQRADTLLSVRVPRDQAGAPRINLELKIPARAHIAIVTGAGSSEVRGLPAALLIQSVSGEIRIELPETPDADLVAASKTGRVSSAFTSANGGNRAELRTRLGSGGRKITLLSDAGNITVAKSIAGSSLSANSRIQSGRSEPNRQTRPRTPVLPPELIGSDSGKPPVGTPAPPITGAQEISDGDIIRVDTELVSVNVSVIDRGTSRGVNDLSKNDFRLYEDRVEQQIAHFDSASAPFNLVLLIDLSGSTARVVELIKAAAIHFVDAARPFDRIGVITFADKQVVVSPLTTDHQLLHQRISAIESPQGSTKLYDSLAFAMEEVFREARDSRRNALVVMSDGLDSVMPNVTGDGSALTHQEIIRRAKEFDGVIYSIWVDTQSYVPLSPKDIQQETFDLAHDRMSELADIGGGAFYECEKLEDLAGAYERVVADLGMVYTLSYRPTNKVRDGSWRTIKVDVNRPNAVARGKRGYFAK